MKFHLPFSANEILWALTFAGYLVLLVVLMGRDRARRFPWFTASSVLIAFRLLTAKMLYGHLAQIPMAELFIGLALLGSLINVGMLLELARKGFRGIKRSAWVAGALTLMILGAIVLYFWGEWPAWQTLTAGGGLIASLQLLQFIALKASLLLDVETVLLGLVIVLFGPRFHAGWKTHVQRIMIGLSTVSLSQIVAEAIAQILGRTAHPKTMEEAQRILGLRDRIFYANSAVLVLALIWWIWCLWKNEPGEDEPVAANPNPVSPNPGAIISQPE
jgi:hypothetical protein